MARTEQGEAKVTVSGSQAEKQLETLRDKARKLKDEMIALQKANDKAGYDKLARELRETSKDIKKYELALKDVDNLMRRLSGASTKELELAQKRLTREIKNSRRETEEEQKALKLKQEQLKLINAEITKHRLEMMAADQTQKGFFGRLTDGFNKYFAIITAASAALMGFIFSLRKMQDSSMEFEDNLANLSALTGLKGRQLDYLGQQASKLATTTTESGVNITKASSDILTAYTVMGSKRPELLKNADALNKTTEAALILAEAGKNELEPSAVALATSMNQFEIGADGANRVINSLAAGSQIGAGEIDFLTEGFVKSGVEMHRANIELEQGVGLLEVLAETGMPAEKAGTSLRNFFLILESGPKETRPSVVGLTGALDALAKKQMDTAAMADLFGRENVTAAAVLIDQRKKVEEYTKAVTGTNVATEQAIINTSTQSAKLKQARNEFEETTRVLGDKLAPILAETTGWGTKFFKLLVAMPQFLRENRTEVIALAGTLLALNGAKVRVLATTIADYTWGQKSIALRVKDQVVLTALIIKEQALAAAQTKTTVAGKLAAAATGGLRAAYTALLGPVGAAILGFTALVAAISWYSKNSASAIREQEAITDAMAYGKEANDVLAKSYDALSKQVQNYNALSEEERKGLRDKIDLTLKQAKANLVELKSRRADVENKATENTSSVSAGGYLSTTWSMVSAAFTGGDPYQAGAKTHVEDYVERVDANVKAATEGIDENIAKIDDEIVALESLSTEINDRANAEAKADAIMGKTLSNLEEKQRLYAIALKDTVKGSADFIRISEKLAKVNKQIGTGEAGLDQKEVDKQNKLIEEMEQKAIDSLERLNREALGLKAKAIAEIEAKYKHDIELAEKYEKEGGKLGARWGAVKLNLIKVRDKEIEKVTLDHQKRLNDSLIAAQRDAGMSLKEQYALDVTALNEKLTKEEIGIKEYYIRLKLLRKKYRDEEQAEKDAKEAKHTDMLSKYGIAPEETEETEQAQLSKDILKNPQVLTEEEIQKARTAIHEKYAKKRAAKEKETQDEMLADMKQNAEIASEIVAGFSSFFQTTKETELQAAGDNEEKKKEINKKYAGIEMQMKIGQAMVSMFAGIVDVWAKYGTMPAVAAVLSGLLFANAMAQVNLADQEAQRVQGYAGGLYQVQDQNGAYYNARGGGQASTQMVSTPSVFLAGEKKPEMIIDGDTMSRIRMNQPGIIDAIMMHKNGTAPRGSSKQVSQQPQASTQPVVFTDPKLSRLMDRIEKLLKDGIKTKFIYKDFKEFKGKIDEAEDAFGMKS